MEHRNSTSIKDHLIIGPGIRREYTTCHGAKLKSINPELIVVHGSGTHTLGATIRKYQNPQYQQSVHILIGRNGQIVQLLPFNRVAWHAGPSAHLDYTGLNQYSIAIELVNAGMLFPCGDGFQSELGHIYPADQALKKCHHFETSICHWHAYTKEQLAVLEQLCFELVAWYNIKHIVGHDEVSTGQVLDPGPALPMNRLRRQVLGPYRSDDRLPFKSPLTDAVLHMKKEFAQVDVALLNMRTAPNVNARLARAPLKEGQVVEVIEQFEDWTLVDDQVQGWVKSQYLVFLDELE